MRSWRRALVGAVGLAACAGIVSACGGGSSSSGDSSSGTVELTFWAGLTGPDRPAVEHLVSGFNASQDKVHVNMTLIPWDVLYQKLLPAYGAGKGPDLVGMDSNQIPVYASKRVLQPVDGLFGSGGADESTILKPALAAGQYDGKTYGVPIENTPVLLYYNKKMFKAAGLNPDQPPTTWSQWQSDAKKLTKGSGPGGRPTQYGIAFGVHDTIEVMPILMWQSNGGILSQNGTTPILDNSGSTSAVSTWANLIAKDHVSPVGLSGADADKLVSSGKAAMEVNGPWATTGYKQAGIDYGLAMVPTGPNGQQITLGNTTSLAIGSRVSGSQVSAAAQFYKYWTTKSAQTYFALHTGFPPLTTNVSASALSSNPDVAMFSKYAGDARGLAPGQPAFAAIQNEIFDPTIEKILNDPSQASSLLGQANTAVAQQVQGG